MDFSPSRSSVHEDRVHKIRIQGTGAADPTVEVGQRVKVTHVTTGQYRITWSEAPGQFEVASLDLGAANPADLKGYSVVRDTYDSTNLQIDFVVFNSSFNAADLAAAQFLDLTITFSTLKNG